MFTAIKNKVDAELIAFTRDLNKTHSLSKISPFLFKNIKEFILRPGKRIRPTLFIVGYLSFTQKSPPHLYRSSLAIELLHDFMLIHDDIIDKSDIRRGKPSMHKMLNNHLKRYKGLKFNGQDLAIVVGDIMYAMAIDAFLAVKEDPERKEKAMRNFIKAAVYTGSGEFIELMSGIKPLEAISKQDIYKIYDYKTAHYTFASPLATGAMLAGAPKIQVDKLSQYGIYLGRAFQINDDIIGIFGDEKKIGKSTLSDLQEAKKTLLIWYAFRKENKKNKSRIKIILSKERVTKADLLEMRKILEKSGALNYAENEINLLLKKAAAIIESSTMKKSYKDCLYAYTNDSLKTKNAN